MKRVLQEVKTSIALTLLLVVQVLGFIPTMPSRENLVPTFQTKGRLRPHCDHLISLAKHVPIDSVHLRIQKDGKGSSTCDLVSWCDKDKQYFLPSTKGQFPPHKRCEAFITKRWLLFQVLLI